MPLCHSTGSIARWTALHPVLGDLSTCRLQDCVNLCTGFCSHVWIQSWTTWTEIYWLTHKCYHKVLKARGINYLHAGVCLSHQASGLGGTAVAGHDADQVATMKPVKERIIKVTFNADRHASMQWNFRPQQTEIFVRPGCLLIRLLQTKLGSG